MYASESQTGDRNRAIAYLLKTNAVIVDDVADVLDVYFRQCAVLVTARDVAVMAATLANRGLNPVTGEQVTTPYAIARTLSVMTSSEGEVETLQLAFHLSGSPPRPAVA